MGFTGFTLEPYGLESLEVLRGPSSVLYGQAEVGGMVNAVSKRPTASRLREVEVSYGSCDRKQVAADVGGPTITTSESNDAYDYRSRLSHGDGFLSDMVQADLTLYDKLEETLRLAILKAFLEPAFATVFTNDSQIEARWPT